MMGQPPYSDTPNPSAPQPQISYHSAPQPFYPAPQHLNAPYPSAPQHFDPSAPRPFNPQPFHHDPSTPRSLNPQPFNPHFQDAQRFATDPYLVNPSAPHPSEPYPAVSQPLKNKPDYVAGEVSVLDGGSAHLKPSGNWEGLRMLRVPEVIETILTKGTSLKLVGDEYHVVDGAQFEIDFKSLRAVRTGKQKKEDRPFSAMHRFYNIIQGEKYAGTGTIFVEKHDAVTGEKRQREEGPLSPSVPSAQSLSPKDSEFFSPPTYEEDSPPRPLSPSTSQSHSNFDPPPVTADSVTVTLTDLEGQSSAVTLQHFLDVTGAGDVYKRCCVEKGESDDAAPWLGMEDDPVGSLDLGKTLGALWNADSRGDQAYFFKRKEHVLPFANGSVVSLEDGEIVPSMPLNSSANCLYMVVSDRNAKWKGEPIPTPEEEAHGHWCAFLGQVPVVVVGSVKCGDHLGPVADGSGYAKVSKIGSGPIIGCALQNKTHPEAGVVKTMVFAGLNNLHGAHQDNSLLHKILEQNCKIDLKVLELEDHLYAVQSNLNVVHEEVGDQKGEMLTLEERVAGVERTQYWTSKAKKAAAEEEVVATPVPTVAGMSVSQLFFHLKKYHPRLTWAFVIWQAVLILTAAILAGYVAKPPPQSRPPCLPQTCDFNSTACDAYYNGTNLTSDGQGQLPPQRQPPPPPPPDNSARAVADEDRGIQFIKGLSQQSGQDKQHGVAELMQRVHQRQRAQPQQAANLRGIRLKGWQEHR